VLCETPNCNADSTTTHMHDDTLPTVNCGNHTQVMYTGSNPATPCTTSHLARLHGSQDSAHAQGEQGWLSSMDSIKPASWDHHYSPPLKCRAEQLPLKMQERYPWADESDSCCYGRAPVIAATTSSSSSTAASMCAGLSQPTAVASSPYHWDVSTPTVLLTTAAAQGCCTVLVQCKRS
jgi:hypothetical protein